MKKLTVWLLCVLTVVSCFAACSEKPGNNDTTAATEAPQTDAEETVVEAE